MTFISLLKRCLIICFLYKLIYFLIFLEIWINTFALLFKKNFSAVLLIYNVVLISGVQHSESVTHIHISIFEEFFSHVGHSRVLSRVPYALQQVLISDLFYI